MQRTSNRGILIWKSPTGLWEPGPFAIVKMKETPSVVAQGKPTSGLPWPWVVEPSFGKGECLVPPEDSGLLFSFPCFSCKIQLGSAFMLACA